MKKVALFALFVLAGVSALNAQSSTEQSKNVGDHPATETLEHFFWITRGND